MLVLINVTLLGKMCIYIYTADYENKYCLFTNFLIELQSKIGHWKYNVVKLNNTFSKGIMACKCMHDLHAKMPRI